MELQLAPPLGTLRPIASTHHRPKASATAAPSTSSSSSSPAEPLKPRPRLPPRSPVPRRPRPGPALCAAIERHAAAGRHAEALDAFRLARAAGPFTPLPPATYRALIAAAAALREPAAAAAVAWHVESSGAEADVYTHNCVLGMYLSCGMLGEARRVFEGMPERNGVTWGIMMGGLVDRGRPRAALALFREMRAEAGGGEARPRAVVVAVRAATASGSLRAGRQLHSCVVKMGLCDDGESGRYLSCALLDMYSKCGRVDLAWRVFDAMMPYQRTIVAWNSMLAGYVLHGHSEEALELYHEMCRSGVAMDQFTFSTMLGVFARLGLLEHAKQAHAGLIQTGLPLDIVGNTALVDLYCKWGRMEDARNVFERMPKRNLISWNALIAGYGYHGMGDIAIEMFERLIAEGIAPNHVTFLAVLNACRFSGLVDKGKRTFQLMAQNPKTKPRAMHYACVIELFGREGLLDEAYSMIRRAPFTPTANMWGALLTASRVHKNMHLAKLAAEQLLAMEPEKINNYAVLLNLYISSGRQDDACKVIETLKKKGLCISNACSWVTVKKKDHRFFFEDSLHPQCAEIYRKLDALMKEVKEAGYVAEENELLPDVHPDEQNISRAYHSERLAIAFGLISTSPCAPLRITQSHRLCRDCHKIIKFFTKVTKREIVVRDGSRFHHFKLGICSCGDYW
ncbi:pentatricopeptide repeat-containing protein At5g50390, chloroplastic-like [Panicum virgatum]|nr:pentatricopeptide repeat-containing protein At5g50390, chloroplastic-like [Panicum virgatum]XP_039852777.1 pentatricopeptide repeat-containing protein At5g50390, chloroplastic-like [Panicum virgatum]XP_039852778.1 pentatricopeptide repeat-containing protein At5g50390, chloroplastic-like [Panicum virgatum]XP_039852779.1 pentatricopeptide repeat-containing protein At5g50390, chloroplastic-like [Panicum virgatum]